MTGFFGPPFPRRLRRESVFDFSFSMAEFRVMDDVGGRGWC